MKGLNQLLKNLNKIEQKSLKAVALGLSESLIDLAKESLKEAPLDQSPLRESLKITVNGQVAGTGNKNASVNKSGSIQPKIKLEASVSYDTPYAVLQHENLSFRHPEPGTKAKYLEHPFSRNKIEKNIEKTLRKVIEK